jgi:ABC-type glycerol-3-phosphate transport system substrate-binding protein
MKPMNRIKKVVVTMVAAALLTGSLASLAAAGDQKWNCSRYYNGEWTGWTAIWASSHDEAMAKAREFYKKYSYTSIKCE